MTDTEEGAKDPDKGLWFHRMEIPFSGIYDENTQNFTKDTWLNSKSRWATTQVSETDTSQQTWMWVMPGEGFTYGGLMYRRDEEKTLLMFPISDEMEKKDCQLPQCLGRFNLQYTGVGSNNFVVTSEDGDYDQFTEKMFLQGEDLFYDGGGWKATLASLSSEVQSIVSAEWAGVDIVRGFIGPADGPFKTRDGASANIKYEVFQGKDLDHMAYVFAAEGEPPLSVPGEEAWHPRVDYHKEHIFLAIGGFAFWSTPDEFGARDTEVYVMLSDPEGSIEFGNPERWEEIGSQLPEKRFRRVTVPAWRKAGATTYTWVTHKDYHGKCGFAFKFEDQSTLFFPLVVNAFNPALIVALVLVGLAVGIFIYLLPRLKKRKKGEIIDDEGQVELVNRSRSGK